MTTDIDQTIADIRHPEAHAIHSRALADAQRERDEYRDQSIALDIELAEAKAEVKRLRAELAEWQGASDTYLIWSHHHQAWFGPNGCGYCQNVNDAGRYTLPDTKQWLGRGCYCCELPEVPVPVGQVLRAGSAELRQVIRAADNAAIKAGDANRHYAGSEAS